MGFNAPEWHISNVAAVLAGGLATGIYATNSAEAVRYVAQHSRANLLVVENEEQFGKVEAVREQLTELAAVVQYTGRPAQPGTLSWQDLLAEGRAVEDSVLQARLAAQAVNQPCMLVYTSGTTGNPKGVMISQDNLTWTVRAAQEVLQPAPMKQMFTVLCDKVYDWNWDVEEGVTYLPLSHVAAQVNKDEF